MNLSWDPAEDAYLRKLWAEDRTGGQIAQLMARTRSSVLARARRLNLSARAPSTGNPKSQKTRAPAPRVQPRPKPPSPPPSIQPPKPRPPVPAAVPVPVALVAPVGTGKPFLDRGAFECAAILDRSLGEPARCCAQPVRPGTSWCQWHASRFFMVR